MFYQHTENVAQFRGTRGVKENVAQFRGARGVKVNVAQFRGALGVKEGTLTINYFWEACFKLVK